MADALDSDFATARLPNTLTVNDANAEGTSAKRRKVRKGTRSCWECKRRKTRCIFESAHDDTCRSCRRRRATCVSQEMPEEFPPVGKGNLHLGKRLARVEDFMKDFLDSKDDMIRYAEQGPRGRFQEVSLTSSLPTPNVQGVSGQTDIESTLDHLFAAFPIKKDVDALLKESSRTSVYNHLINTQPHSKLTHEKLAGPYSEATLPRHNSHPVLVATHMLILALTLQIPYKDKIVDLSELPDVIERRLVTAATMWVTTKEEMQGTVECLYCIMLEGVYEINRSNLRRAWGVYRRAMTVAQLMGLHRTPMPPLKRIDPEMDINPEMMWFRIVYMDRYLSLLLGLPQGTCDKSMRAMSLRRDELPLGRFERQLSVIASRILERNERDFAPSELTTTESIDAELLKVAKDMPASFWRPATFRGHAVGEPSALLETLRLGVQVYYYGLLIQLHLPYMMRIGDTTEHDYAKITCANAGREILTRFIAHRSFNPVSSCSRPVDFFALLAAMTLLLAHCDAQYSRGATNILAHQRLSDRAMLDQALEIMDVMINVHGNVLAERSAELVRQLLDVEANVAEGSKYITSSMEGDEEIQEDKEEGEVLRMHIPYLGIVKMARQQLFSRASPQTATLRPHTTSQAQLSRREPCLISRVVPSSLHTEPSTDKQLLDHQDDLAPEPAFPENILSSKHSTAQLQTFEDEQSALQFTNSSHDRSALLLSAELPSTAAGLDDWTFQGVDTAFFDTLMRGTSSEDSSASEQQWIDVGAVANADLDSL